VNADDRKALPLAVFIIAGIWFIDRTSRTCPRSAAQASAAAISDLAYGGYEVTGAGRRSREPTCKDVPSRSSPLIIVSVMSLTSLVATGCCGWAATRTPLRPPRSSCAGGAALISIGSVVSMTGNNMGQLLNGSRTIFALAENGDLPRWFGKVHAEYRTPANAILFCAALALILALTGSFVALAAVSAIARLVMYLAVCMATLVLRKRDHEIAAQVGAHFTEPLQAIAPPKFTVPFGPVIPILASIVALGILAGATRTQLTSGVAALAAGAVLYFLAPRQK
jgi:amino acid transporter